MRSVSLAMVVLLCAVGCGGAGIRVSTAPKTPRRPLLLWRVTAPGVAPTYLFGTCHAGVSLDRGLPADHRAALDNARVVALEVDGESVLDPRQIMSALMLPEDQSLRALVGEGLWRELVRQLPNTGLRWMAIDRFHPFMATAMLSLAASGASRGAAHEDGMETTIARRARARGVRVAGLETVADQIRLVTGQQPSASVPALRTTLEHPREAGTMMRAVFFACAWGSDEMITLATHDSPDAIFAARNAVWLPRVELYVRDGGAFIAVGAYTAATLTALGLPVVVTIPGAGLASAAAGMVFGIPSLRLKGLYLAMATLAAHFIIEFVVIRWRSVTGGTSGIVVDTPALFGFAFGSAAKIFYLIFVLVIAAVLFARNLFRTRIGRALVAVRDKDISAEVMGIPLFRYKLLAFGVSSFYAGVAGALLAYQAGIITPENFPITVAIDYLAMIIIGGLGSVLGAVLGAIFMTLVPDLLRLAATALSGTYPALIGLIVTFREAVFGLLIILFLIFEPDGMAARWRTIKAYWKLWPFSY